MRNKTTLVLHRKIDCSNAHRWQTAIYTAQNLQAIYHPGAGGFLHSYFFWMPEKIPPPECFLSWAVMLIASSVISVNTIWIETHSWAVLLVSVDSSHSSEKHSQSEMSLQRCCVKSSALNPRRCITVLLDSRRDFIDDNICSLFLKSQNKESAASTKASFIIICFRLLLASAVWKTTVVLLTSSLTFLFLSSLFSEASQCRTFYEKFESGSKHSPSSELRW